jgi:hypothetical protein
MGSFSVIASAILGISHAGMEICLQYKEASRERQPIIFGDFGAPLLLQHIPLKVEPLI